MGGATRITAKGASETGFHRHRERRTRRDAEAVAATGIREAAENDDTAATFDSDMRRRDLANRRDLQLRDLSAAADDSVELDEDLTRRGEVRDVDYDYIFGDDINDDDADVLVITRFTNLCTRYQHGRRQRGGRGAAAPLCPMPCPSPAAPSRRKKKLYVPSRPFPSIVAA